MTREVSGRTLKPVISHEHYLNEEPRRVGHTTAAANAKSAQTDRATWPLTTCPRAERPGICEQGYSPGRFETMKNFTYRRIICAITRGPTLSFPDQSLPWFQAIQDAAEVSRIDMRVLDNVQPVINHVVVA
jgi:hypothetical protein